MIKFLSGLALLLVALVLQCSFASAGVYINVALATLITFAFLFEFWELTFFVLLAVFLLNWQPAPSVVLVIFALIPFAAFAFRIVARSESWIGNLAAIFFGFLVFYIVVSPNLFFGGLGHFFLDLLIGIIAGEILFFALSQKYSA